MNASQVMHEGVVAVSSGLPIARLEEILVGDAEVAGVTTAFEANRGRLDGAPE